MLNCCELLKSIDSEPEESRDTSALPIMMMTIVPKIDNEFWAQIPMSSKHMSFLMFPS